MERKQYPEGMGCLFNNAIRCSPDQKNCEACGWNPKVSEARLQKFCEKTGTLLPKPQKKEK